MMNHTTDQSEHPLGTHRNTYLPTVLTGRILLGTALTCLVISLLPFSTAISKSRTTYTVLSDHFRQESIVVNAVIGALLLLVSVILFALYYHHKRRRVDLYTDGLLLTDWRRSRAIRWDDVTEVYASPVYRRTTRGYSHRRIVNWIYHVHTRDGERVKIGGLEGMGSLGRVIQEEITKRLLPQALDAYQAGDEVRFGPQLRLSQRGVAVGAKRLDWADIATVNLDQHNHVMILKKGQRLPWKQLGSDKVANPTVLKGILGRLQIGRT